MQDTIQNFIYDHFIEPGYDLVNTITYGIILALFVLLITWIIRKFKLEIDFKFALSLIPFIFFGATTRALVDAGFFTGYSPEAALTPFMPVYWFVSPGIYITMFIIASAALLSSPVIQKYSGIKYYWIMFSLGLLPALHNLLFIISRFSDMDIFLKFCAVFAASLASIFIINLIFEKLKKIKDLNLSLNFEKNYLILASHFFDASTTYAGITFRQYSEKHVVPDFLISQAGTAAVMFPLKFLIVILIIYFLDRYVEDKNTRRFIKIVILIIGIGPGLRNLARMVMGV